MKKNKKRPQGAATPKGTETKKSHNQFNIQIPEEQEKTEKIMELIRLALRINGLSERRKKKTGNLPTAMFEFFGHTANLEFRLYEDGWEPDYTKYSSMDMYVDDELHAFNEKYEKIKGWLMDFWKMCDCNGEKI